MADAYKVSQNTVLTARRDPSRKDCANDRALCLQVNAPVKIHAAGKWMYPWTEGAGGPQRENRKRDNLGKGAIKAELE